MMAPLLDAVHADPWADDFVDLPTLNAKAANAIEDSVQVVRNTARAEPRSLRSTSIAVLGPPGAGKTHLFARLRRRLGARAIFVHVRPLLHAPITSRFLLGEAVRQLGYATQGLVQLDTLVGSILARLSGAAAYFPSAFLSDYQMLSESEREAKLDDAVEQILALWQEVDDGYLSRLLRAPFASGATRRATMAWLSGRDCDVGQLARIGATASLGDDLATPALRTLCSVASLGSPLVFVFDQLENLIDGPEPGLRLLGYLNLAAELVDTMRGLVLVHMALDTEWNRAIEPSLNLSQRSRILMRRETLTLPTRAERDDLLRLWIDHLPQRKAPYPWPFTEERLAGVLRAPGMTPRMLLIECKRALNGDDGEPEAGRATLPGAPEMGTLRCLAAEWEANLDAARRAVSEADEQHACVDAGRLADGLLACGAFLDGARLAPNASDGPAQLILQGVAGPTSIALLSQQSHQSLGAALDKLAALAANRPVIAIRERARDFPPTWKGTLTKRDALLGTGRGRWIWLDAEDVTKLLALDALLRQARSGDVTNERGEPVDATAVVEWARTTLDPARWTAVGSLLHRGDGESTEEGPPGQATEPPSAPPPTTVLPASSGAALAVVRQLRIASLERVIREVARIEPRATRASILAELEANAGEVRFFGRSIVCVRART